MEGGGHPYVRCTSTRLLMSSVSAKDETERAALVETSNLKLVQALNKMEAVGGGEERGNASEKKTTSCCSFDITMLTQCMLLTDVNDDDFCIIIVWSWIKISPDSGHT